MLELKERLELKDRKVCKAPAELVLKVYKVYREAVAWDRGEYKELRGLLLLKVRRVSREFRVVKVSKEVAV
jgi:hypothetical protein